MKEIEEHDLVVLTRDIADNDLKKEDIGTVVHRYDGGEAFEVEFGPVGGPTIGILTLRGDELRPIRSTEILHARDLAPA